MPDLSQGVIFCPVLQTGKLRSCMEVWQISNCLKQVVTFHSLVFIIYFISDASTRVKEVNSFIA